MMMLWRTRTRTRSTRIFSFIFISSLIIISSGTDSRDEAAHVQISQLQTALSAMTMASQERLAVLEDQITKLQQRTVNQGKRLADTETHLRDARRSLQAQEVWNANLQLKVEALLMGSRQRAATKAATEEDILDDREAFNLRIAHVKKYGWDPDPGMKTASFVNVDDKGVKGTEEEARPFTSTSVDDAILEEELAAERAATLVELAAGPLPDAEYDQLYDHFAGDAGNG